jgi:8-hydroxy-5-deazaflavin:NADPH oxidoreductase
MLSNSRGPDSLADVVKELGAGATAGTPQQVAEQDIVVLAARWSNVQAALFAVPEWKGRILVDATNRVASYTPLTLGDISGRTSSEIVADLAGGARVVKAFNSVPMDFRFLSHQAAHRPVHFRGRRRRQKAGQRPHRGGRL